MKIPCDVAIFIYLFVFKLATHVFQTTTENQSEKLIK